MYNYITVTIPRKKDNLVSKILKSLFIPITFIRHKLLNDLPYQLGGKVRRKYPKKVPIQLEKKLIING